MQEAPLLLSYQPTDTGAAVENRPIVENGPVVDSSNLSCARPRSPVAHAAQVLLDASPFLLLKTVSCEHHEGALILRGTLPSYYLKQMAQATVLKTPGVLEIHNRIEVTSPAPAV